MFADSANLSRDCANDSVMLATAISRSRIACRPADAGVLEDPSDKADCPCDSNSARTAGYLPNNATYGVVPAICNMAFLTKVASLSMFSKSTFIFSDLA